MPWDLAKVSARPRSRAATATRRVPVAAAGPTMDSSLMRAAPSTPMRSGSTYPSPRGDGEQAADVVGAGAYVGHGSFAAGLLAEDRVLLEGVPAAVAVALERVHDGLDVDVAGAERAVHPLDHALGVAEPAGSHLVRDLAVHVLEVGVRDAVRSLPGQLGRVRAADEQVASVQAQGDGGPAEHPLHLVTVLDHGAHMGVQHG